MKEKKQSLLAGIALRKNKNRIKIDYYFLFAVLALAIIGIVAMMSAAAISAHDQGDSGKASYFFSHHLLNFFIGIVCGLFAFFLPLNFFRKLSLTLVLLGILLMFAVAIPALNLSAGGAERWINIGVINFQPSEFFKLAFIIYFSAWLAGLKNKKNDSHRSQKSINISFVPFLCILGLLVILIIKLQSDLSTLMVISFTAAIMYFLAGTPFLHTFYVFLIGVAGLFWFIRFEPYRLSRFMVVFNLWKDPFAIIDPMNTGYHIKNALITIGAGGLFGVGTGMASQNLIKFPPHITSDSIFAIIAYEGGFVFSFFVLTLFLFIFWRCFYIADRSKDNFAKLFVIGVGSWICLQAFINIGSMVGIVPIAGIPLPLISYGGSHIIAELIAIGIVLNVSKHNKA